MCMTTIIYWSYLNTFYKIYGSLMQYLSDYISTLDLYSVIRNNFMARSCWCYYYGLDKCQNTKKSSISISVLRLAETTTSCFFHTKTKLLDATLSLWWGEEQTSNFSFSNSAFYPFRVFSTIFIKFRIVVCKLLQFGII